MKESGTLNGGPHLTVGKQKPRLGMPPKQPIALPVQQKMRCGKPNKDSGIGSIYYNLLIVVSWLKSNPFRKRMTPAEGVVDAYRAAGIQFPDPPHLATPKETVKRLSFWGRMFRFTPKQIAQLNRRADEVAKGLA